MFAGAKKNKKKGALVWDAGFFNDPVGVRHARGWVASEVVPPPGASTGRKRKA